MQPNIVTSRWNAYRSDWGVPVCITVGKPKWVTFPFVEVPELAPWELFRGGGYREMAVEDERRIYRRRLHRKAHVIKYRLEDLGRMYQGSRLVLLCYENVEVGQICHRRWFAEWAKEKWGWEIPEINTQRRGHRVAEKARAVFVQSNLF